MRTPLTLPALKQHLTYNWWKYLLLALLSFGLIDLLYSMTQYRPPKEKKIEFYVYGLINEEPLTEYLDHVHADEMSDMEVLSPQMMTPDESYGPMQLMTYLTAGEGDVYLLPRDQFVSYASSGALVPLEDDGELISFFDENGVSLQSGWRKNAETGETHLYGIPQVKLPGLYQYAVAQDGFLCLIVTGGNIENGRKFLRILSRDMITAPEESAGP